MPKDVTCVTKVLDFPVLSTNFWRKTAKVLSTKKKVMHYPFDVEPLDSGYQHLHTQLTDRLTD